MNQAMPSRMSPKERASYYGGRIHMFEHSNGWNIGKYALSEVFAIIALGAFLAWGLPRIVSPDTLFMIGVGALVIMAIYLLIVFSLSGGRGKVVDVI